MADTNSEKEEATKADKAILIRVVEWGEWIPSNEATEPEVKGLKLNNGYTGVSAGESERLLELLSQNTLKEKTITIENRDTGREEKRKYIYYAFQATLAQNVSEPVIEELLELQRPPKVDPDAPRNRRDDLIVIKNGQPVSPNRAEIRRAERRNN